MSVLQSVCPASQLQLALALAIVKSKPTNTSILDHVIGFRNHIALGRKKQLELAGEKHVDSTAFWREAYEKSEAAQSQLLDKIYNLEQKNEALLLQIKPENGPKTKQTMKRGTKTDDIQLSAPPPPKRTKTTCLGRQNSTLSFGQGWVNNGSVGFEFSEHPTSSLMRHFHTIQRLLRKKSNFETLAITVVEFCKSFETTNLSAMPQGASKTSANNKDKGLQPKESTLEPTLKVLERCYPSILQGLAKVSRSNPESSGSGLMVYHIVQLFRKTLQQMHQYTISKARKALAPGKSAAGTKQRPRTGRKTTNSTGKAKVGLSRDEERVLGCFSHAIVMMLLSLDPEMPGQGDLLEGFLFVILEHVGKTLGLFVFEQLLSEPKLDANDIKHPIPGCLLQEQRDAVEPPVDERAAVWNSKHLIWILERAMVFLDQHKAALKLITRSETSATESPFHLLDIARTKLQNSLLKGVFGSDDVEFDDSLKVPEEITCTQTDNDNTASLATPEEGVGEWFAQEVWRIVGWDSLLGFQRPT